MVNFYAVNNTEFPKAEHNITVDEDWRMTIRSTKLLSRVLTAVLGSGKLNHSNIDNIASRLDVPKLFIKNLITQKSTECKTALE